ncbi:MAG: Histidinol-phosphate aminotransferase [Porticoccaceae bacterium UBA1117]|jgi:histidinol-phosphate aminotransferase|nr:MAG: Histidinol-phosphate aminotransferase [Porticoccaceae bacterium UBA1117]
MSKYWSSLVNQLQPYIPGEQPSMTNITKLNTNENPYGPSPLALSAMKSLLNQDLRLYPPPSAGHLKEAVARYYELNADQVFLGNGSDEVLAHIFNGLLKQSEPLLFPDISYSFYPVFCKLYDISFIKIPLTDDLSLNLNNYKRPNGGIIFPNPNAPTGRLLPLKAIEELLKENQHSVVVVDEAYIDFGGQSAVVLINKYANLVVVQTMSKARSLAGMRIGYALGSAELIEGLERVKNSFNSYPLGHLQIAAGIAAFEDKAHFDSTRQQVISSRDWLSDQLKTLGFNVLPSAANFLFVQHTHKSAEIIHEQLRDLGIIVRHFKQPRIEEFLRITVGTDVQNRQLVSALGGLLE